MRITDEFSPLRLALLHRPENATDTQLEHAHLTIPPDELADHPESGDVRRDRMLAQHDLLVQALEQFHVRIVNPVSVEDAAAQVFTRDPCFVVGSTLFLAALRDTFRLPERQGLAELAGAVGPRVVDLAGPGSLIEGGDVIVLDRGRKVLVGTNRHTNEEGIRRLRKALKRTGTEVVPVPHRALHLDCCVAPLPSGEAVYCPSKLPEGSIGSLRMHFRRLHMAPRDESERHLAANMLWIDPGHVIANHNAPRTVELLRKLGFEVIDLEFTDLVHLWGSFRCAVCPLVRSEA
jgi:N-dimethylarginine dimethylaminohydrolase